MLARRPPVPTHLDPDVLALPQFGSEPTGAMRRVLRRMAGGSVLVVVKTPGGLVASLDADWLAPPLVAGLLTRGLIQPVADCGDQATIYTLTADGRVWAERTAEVES